MPAPPPSATLNPGPNPGSRKAVVLIPARFASTRFPGKPLANDTGRPLIQHVVERLDACATVKRVVVATDDQRIHNAVLAFGGASVMTGAHDNGTARLAEAAATLGLDDDTLVVNVQGDEPEIPPATVDALVNGLAADPGADMATLAAVFGPHEDTHDPNVVKMVITQQNRAMYFSRSPIPFDRDQAGAQTVYKHPGLYAYRKTFLDRYADLAPTPNEQAEKLEQLRVLEHGFVIAVIHADAPHPGIDTPAQYAAFVARQRSGQVAN